MLWLPFERVTTRLWLQTDVAARGLDIEGLIWSSTTTFPSGSDYLHRIGRTGAEARQVWRFFRYPK